MRKPIPLSAAEWVCLIPTVLLVLAIITAACFVVLALVPLLVDL
jgi:hypothetical protein